MTLTTNYFCLNLSNVMKQDMEFIKLIIQTLADHKSHFVMLEALAKRRYNYLDFRDII